MNQKERRSARILSFLMWVLWPPWCFIHSKQTYRIGWLRLPQGFKDLTRLVRMQTLLVAQCIWNVHVKVRKTNNSVSCGKRQSHGDRHIIWCRFLYLPIVIGTCTLRPPLVASRLLGHTCRFLVPLVSLKMLVPNNKSGCWRILVLWFVVVFFTIFVWNWVSFDSSSWPQTRGPSTLSFLRLEAQMCAAILRRPISINSSNENGKTSCKF